MRLFNGLCAALLTFGLAFSSTAQEPGSLPTQPQVSDGNYGWFKVEKFGENVDVDTGTDPEDIWGGTAASGAAVYPFLASGTALFVSSDSASDTTAVTIEGLDTNGDLQTSEITLVGITFTAAGTWLRVNRMYNSGATAFVGNIYVHTDTTDGNADGIPDDPATQLMGYIAIVDGQTLQAIYTVPNDHTAYIYGWCASIARFSGSATEREGDVTLFTRENGGSFRAKHRHAINNRGDTHTCTDFANPLKVGELTDIKLTVTTASTNTSYFGTFHLLVKPDQIR